MQFPDYGTVLWYPGSRNCSRKAGKHCDFSTYFTKRARAQFGACAEVQLPGYGSVLWGSFLIMEQCSTSLAVEIFKGKHCDFIIYLVKRTRA
jgi:hypothetical protein